MARHLLTGEELTSEELAALVERALELKRARLREREDARGGLGARPGAGPLVGRHVALVFERPSTRTRVSFEVGVRELGGNPIVLRGDEMQLSRGESPADTGRVLGRFVDLVAIRTGAHSGLEELAAHSEVPVVNMLSSDHHPCQALADLLTLRERFGRLDGLRVAYVGDGNNVAVSLMVLGALAGLEVVVATPPELAPPRAVADAASAAGPGRAELTADPAAAAAGAHALYTDVWVSMGDEHDADRRRALLAPYRLDAALLERADPDAVALHCLPAHPGEEIDADVLYGPRSAVWDQAENRLHAQKALLELLLGDGGRSQARGRAAA